MKCFIAMLGKALLLGALVATLSNCSDHNSSQPASWDSEATLWDESTWN